MTNKEVQAALARVAWLQEQAIWLRKTETSSENYQASVSGFLAEIARMQSEVRKNLNLPPTEEICAANWSG